MKYIFMLIACFWFVSPAEAQIQKVWLDADLAQLKIVKTPPENTQRNIRVFIKIDEKALAEDFWKVLKQ